MYATKEDGNEHCSGGKDCEDWVERPEETDVELVDRARILRQAIDAYGPTAQMTMMVEECSELIKALCKHQRDSGGTYADNVCEEIADVQIVLDQMKMIFSPYTIAQFEEQKLKRLRERLEEIDHA